jgi:transcriptional regulator with XRE-family HTH domain
MLEYPTFRVKPYVGRSNTSAAGLCFRLSMSNENMIRTLRKARGLTQTALAAEIGWERGTIAAIEAGHDKPGADLVRALADFFGTTADAIMGRSGEATPAAAQSDAEAELLRLFRAAPDTGKAAVLATLRAVTHSQN